MRPWYTPPENSVSLPPLIVKCHSKMLSCCSENNERLHVWHYLERVCGVRIGGCVHLQRLAHDSLGCWIVLAEFGTGLQIAAHKRIQADMDAHNSTNQMSVGTS